MLINTKLASIYQITLNCLSSSDSPFPLSSHIRSNSSANVEEGYDVSPISIASRRASCRNVYWS